MIPYLKYFPKLRKEYNISRIETLLFGLFTIYTKDGFRVSKTPVRKIAHDLDTSPSYINQSIKKLKEINLIKEVDDEFYSRAFVLTDESKKFLALLKRDIINKKR